MFKFDKMTFPEFWPLAIKILQVCLRIGILCKTSGLWTSSDEVRVLKSRNRNISTHGKRLRNSKNKQEASTGIREKFLES